MAVAIARRALSARGGSGPRQRRVEQRRAERRHGGCWRSRGSPRGWSAGPPPMRAGSIGKGAGTGSTAPMPKGSRACRTGARPAPPWLSAGPKGEHAAIAAAGPDLAAAGRLHGRGVDPRRVRRQRCGVAMPAHPRQADGGKPRAAGGLSRPPGAPAAAVLRPRRARRSGKHRRDTRRSPARPSPARPAGPTAPGPASAAPSACVQRHRQAGHARKPTPRR
jgi:hypothetical protein